jgi:hypothetical protein
MLSGLPACNFVHVVLFFQNHIPKAGPKSMIISSLDGAVISRELEK